MHFVLDAASSSILIHTFAEGLFSRLAHDLEIAAHDVVGTADVTTEHSAAATTAALTMPVAGLSVVGVVKNGKLDTSALSLRDRSDIEDKIKHGVLAGAANVAIVVSVSNESARIDLTTAHDQRSNVTCAVTTRVGKESAEARGRCDLSLRALGIAAVRGPLGAFRLSDRIEVVFHATFRAVP
jgi:hypothetical protein